MFESSLFSFEEPGQRFVDIVYPFKTLPLGFTDFSHFKISISFMIFIMSFLLLSLAFVLFLIPLGGNLGCSFEMFLIFSGRPALLGISYLELFLLHLIDFVDLCFHCHLSQDILKFPLWFHHLPIDIFSSILFSLHVLFHLGSLLPYWLSVWKICSLMSVGC